MASEAAQTLPRLAYSDREVAGRLGTSRSYVRTLMDSGELPSVKIGGRRLIRAVDLDALLTPTSPAAGPILVLTA